ncbi:hypothetical protein Leryth_007853 [Lithospermum erythrorhizon]|nr:hypothetical protein Leryth_007853 [Lithospermum erythrorhizon]
MNYALTPPAQLLCRAVVILYSCLVEKMNEVVLLSVKAELGDVLHKIDLRKIYFMCLSAYFEKPKAKYECTLLTNAIRFLEFNKMPPQNHPCEELYKVLKSLQIGMHTILEETEREELNASVKTLIMMAIPILFLCNKDQKLEVRYVDEAEHALSHVCDQTRHIEEKFLVLKLHKYPKTRPLGFLEFFCSYIKELQEFRAQQIETLKDEIQALYQEFNLLRYCLIQTKQPKELNDLPEQIMSLAYDALYVIDFFLVYGSSALIKPSVSRIRNIVTPVRREIEALSTGFEALRETEEKDSIFPSQVNTPRAFVEEAKLMPYEGEMGKTTSGIPTQVSTFPEIDFVGFEDEARKAMESLADNTYENHVISIVGMPGIGKTTLANKLYKDPIIRGHFDVRAWCTVSQTYRKTELWHSILRQVSGIDAAGEYDDERIAEKIAQSLKRRRYLIVIDDMWDILAWKDLRRYLPNDFNGSRVLITTRHHNVAEQTASSSSNIYNLRLFNEEESLELFDRKLSLKDNCQEDLLQVGHQIALSCQGLPLAIAVIAGHVLKVDRKVERWKEIAESLTSCILRDPERPYRAMLEWSYNYLPNRLKPCFLYTGALGACQYIPVRKLKLLWIAEGLVQSNNCENLDTRAEDYLMDLISRSLVTPTHNKAIGGVKACVMHDLLREFCAEISEEESFMHIINVDSWPQLFGSKDQVLLSQLERLSIWSRGYDFLNERPSSTGLGVQSLLCFSRGQFIRENYEFDVTFVCMNFKLLRVLNIDEMDICNSIDIIVLLVHLRYLAVCADLQQSISIPSSIASLWKLQSLIVKSSFVSRIDIIDVPHSLWDMVNLRNVHIDYFARFQVDNGRVENLPFSENIETLSRPCFSSTEDAKKLLGRLQKLQKLTCTFLHCWDDSTNCYQFPILDFLTQLVSLKIFWMDSSKNLGARHEFSFPLNLKKLTLTAFVMMSWDELSDISKKLPNLEVLKIQGSCHDGTWDVGDEDFPNLKYLKLSHRYITNWFASEESFPKLEQLHLKLCKKLEEIPPWFEEAPCLQIITLESCNSHLCDSALRIEKMQKEEAQNSEFRVDILK